MISILHKQPQGLFSGNSLEQFPCAFYSYLNNLNNKFKIYHIDFCIQDYKTWYYSDEDFLCYLQGQIGPKIKYLCLFEQPFNYIPSGVSTEAFIKKLYQRTEQIINFSRKNFQETKILSPPIYIIQEQYRQLYIDYLVYFRNDFDIYALHCVNDYSEHSLAKLYSMTREVMSILPKEIYVRKWAVPSRDQEMLIRNQSLSSQLLNSVMTYDAAARKLKEVFKDINFIGAKGVEWFYTGVYQDGYDHKKTPTPDQYWNPLVPEYHAASYDYSWQFFHFLGTKNYQGIIKQPIVDTLLELSETCSMKN